MGTGSLGAVVLLFASPGTARAEERLEQAMLPADGDTASGGAYAHAVHTTPCGICYEYVLPSESVAEQVCGTDREGHVEWSRVWPFHQAEYELRLVQRPDLQSQCTSAVPKFRLCERATKDR